MKDLLNKYLELVNHNELLNAVANRLDEPEKAEKFFDKYLIYSSFLHDICRITGDLVCTHITTATYMGVEVCYYKTFIL